MHSKSQPFLKYFKSEAKSLSRSSKLKFNLSFWQNLSLINTLCPASNLGEKVADFSEQSSRCVLSVVVAY